MDFGFGRAGAGGGGHVANEDVWPCWPRESGLVGGTQACNQKVAGSIPPHARFCWKPSPDFRPRVVEIGAQFRRNYGPGGAAQNVRSTSRGTDQCVSARGVNITSHRPCVQTQETSTSHNRIALWIFVALGKYTSQASFSNKTYSWTKPSQTS